MNGWDGNGDPGQGFGPQGQGFMGDMHNFQHRGNWGMNMGHNSGAHPLMMILCIALFALGVFLLLRLISHWAANRTAKNCNECQSCGFSTSAASSGTSESPREILDRRFAQGKIKRKKYLAARDLLS